MHKLTEMEGGTVAGPWMVVGDGGWVQFRFCFGRNSNLIWVLLRY